MAMAMSIPSPSSSDDSLPPPTPTTQSDNMNNNNNNNTTTNTNAAAAPASPTIGTSGSKRKPSRRANTAERRATHNAVERQRRETLNGRFLDLAALLPNLSQIRRPSKSAIVNSSIAHIHASRRHRMLASRELRALKGEADALRREVNEWRERAGIPRCVEGERGEAFSMVLSGELEVLNIGGNPLDEEDEDGMYGVQYGDDDGLDYPPPPTTGSTAHPGDGGGMMDDPRMMHPPVATLPAHHAAHVHHPVHHHPHPAHGHHGHSSVSVSPPSTSAGHLPPGAHHHGHPSHPHPAAAAAAAAHPHHLPPHRPSISLSHPSMNGHSPMIASPTGMSFENPTMGMYNEPSHISGGPNSFTTNFAYNVPAPGPPTAGAGPGGGDEKMWGVPHHAPAHGHHAYHAQHPSSMMLQQPRSATLPTSLGAIGRARSSSIASYNSGSGSPTHAPSLTLSSGASSGSQSPNSQGVGYQDGYDGAQGWMMGAPNGVGAKVTGGGAGGANGNGVATYAMMM